MKRGGRGRPEIGKEQQQAEQGNKEQSVQKTAGQRE